MSLKVIVTGSGIGGLSAAIGLRQAGFDVSVYERHPELRTAGAGLNVWPNGARVLYGLGLQEQFESTANLLDSYKTYSSSGELIGDEDLVAYRTRFGAPVSGVYRRELSAMLATALGEDSLHFDHEVVDVEDTGEGVVCSFADGERVEGDLLIGADGLNSVVRHKLFGDREFKIDNHVRWRGIFEVEDAGIDPKTEVDVIGDHGHLGWLPIGRGLAYWYAAGEGLDEQSKIMEYFGSWTGSKVPDVLRATRGDTIIRNELMDFAERLEQWGRGRITLLGDAAHPMLPGVAQGANQALVDSAVLAKHLGSTTDVEHALRSYEAERKITAEEVVRVSRSLFDYDSKLDEFHAVSNNPIFHHYANIVEKAPAS